jgi:hypothetical protein
MTLTTRPRRRPSRMAGPNAGGPGRPRPRPARGKSATAATGHQEELAPNRRTFAGKPPSSLDAGGTALGAGTHTMCMSECTSMPAAWGWRTDRAGGVARGSRAPGSAGRVRQLERLRGVMGRITLSRWDESSRRGPRGDGKGAVSPTGSTWRLGPPRVTHGRVAASRARLQDGHGAPVSCRPRARAGLPILSEPRRRGHAAGR